MTIKRKKCTHVACEVKSKSLPDGSIIWYLRCMGCSERFMFKNKFRELIIESYKSVIKTDQSRMYELLH